LRRFLRPGASDAKSPSGPVRKRKSASTAGFFAGFSLRFDFNVRFARLAARVPVRTLKLVDEGFCRSGNRPTLEPLTCCGISKWGSDGSVLQEENLFVGRFWDCALLLAD
jgi:hypothetical protein